MKLLLPLLFISFASFAQKGYVSVRGGAFFKDGTTAAAFISGGLLQKKNIGIGIGVGYVDFNKPYIPLTLDLTLFAINDKVSPMILAQGGYGFYNDPKDITTIKGGLTGSLNAGVSIPVNKLRLFLLGGVQTFQFRSTEGSIAQQGSSYGNSFSTGFILTAGIKL